MNGIKENTIATSYRINEKKIYHFLKRMIDIILSLLALIMLFPLIVVFSIIIKCETKGPILFKQKRVGKNKKYFVIYKFRSMRSDTPRDMPTHKLKDANEYITKFGGFIRKTSIDELPQLLNILKRKYEFCRAKTSTVESR